ncbi:hypothetical protein DIPPA_28129 [Diplonema papillatum]|nr:hypothetical protein DIPPA_28129 [Diplonema papillatum]
MDTAQRQAAQAYSDSATAKGWAMRTALSRLGKIARVKAVHPALEMRVNHLTSLGGPILQGLNTRPQINNREAFEAVMRAFEVAAVRHVPKKMAQRTGRPERPLGEGGRPDRQLPTPDPLPTGVATQRREVEGTGKTRPGDAPPCTRRRQPPPLGRPSEHREEESDAQRQPTARQRLQRQQQRQRHRQRRRRENARKDPRHTSVHSPRGGMAVEPSPGMTKAGENRGQ